MEFTIVCPVDGPIEVGLEDVEAVVLRDDSRADITFICPQCGSEIAVTAIVPAFLISALQALSEDPDHPSIEGILITSADTDLEDLPPHDHVIDESDPRYDAYCEYFRRQLGHVESVEDALAEIDSRAKAR